MSIAVERLEKHEWKALAKNAHEIIFSEEWDEEIERIDYALLTKDVEVKNSLIQYATIKELDAETGYISYGGSFPAYRGTVTSYKSFLAILNYLYDKYTWVSFLTENTNVPMLKFALKEGFVIVGMRNFKGKVLLEHLKQKGA